MVEVYILCDCYRLWLQIDPLQKEAQIVNEMYELIEQFTVPTPPEDFAVYQVQKRYYLLKALSIAFEPRM